MRNTPSSSSAYEPLSEVRRKSLYREADSLIDAGNWQRLQLWMSEQGMAAADLSDRGVEGGANYSKQDALTLLIRSRVYTCVNALINGAPQDAAAPAPKVALPRTRTRRPSKKSAPNLSAREMSSVTLGTF